MSKKVKENKGTFIYVICLFIQFPLVPFPATLVQRRSTLLITPKSITGSKTQINTARHTTFKQFDNN